MTRQLRVVVVAWGMAFAGAFLGGLIGSTLGEKWRFLAAMVGGTLAILYMVGWLVRRGWYDGDRRRGGTIGALCGFALAAPIAWINLDLPLVPVLIVALVGLGMVAGGGWRAAR